MNRERYLAHFLPKLVAPEAGEWIKSLLAIENDYIYQLCAYDDEWVWFKFNLLNQIVSALVLNLLFNIEFDDDIALFDLNLYKKEFNIGLAQLKKLSELIIKKIEFSNKPITIVDKKMEIDISDMKNGEFNPIVYLNSEAISLEQLASIKNNMWSTMFDDHIEILDSAVIEQCNKLLAIKEFHQKKGGAKEQVYFQRQLHLLDWITLKKKEFH